MISYWDIAELGFISFAFLDDAYCVTEKFVHLPNGAIQHVSSRKCLHFDASASYDTNLPILRFTEQCDDPAQAFRHTSSGQLVHARTGHCASARCSLRWSQADAVLDPSCHPAHVWRFLPGEGWWLLLALATASCCAHAGIWARKLSKAHTSVQPPQSVVLTAMLGTSKATSASRPTPSDATMHPQHVVSLQPAPWLPARHSA